MLFKQRAGPRRLSGSFSKDRETLRAEKSPPFLSAMLHLKTSRQGGSGARQDQRRSGGTDELEQSTSVEHGSSV